MTIDQNKELVRAFYGLLNAGRVEAMGDLVIAEYVEHDPLPGQGEGRDGVLDRFSILTSSLAPRFTIDDVIAEEDKVVVRWTNRGTHVAISLVSPPRAVPSRSPASTSTGSRATASPSIGT